MSNELLLILSIFVSFSLVLLCFKFFRKQGLYLWTAVATILADIEVLLLVHAFGIDMTLGNVLFASTFLVTDILSELYGKKDAQQAVLLGVTATVLFFVVCVVLMLFDLNRAASLILVSIAVVVSLLAFVSYIRRFAGIMKKESN